MYNTGFLRHYGILGMHWGRRKGSTPHAVAVKKNISEDHNTHQQLKRKPIHEMTNAELKKFTERANLERQYKDLTKKEVSRGRKIVEEILGGVAKDIAKSYLKSQAEKHILKK